VVARVEESFLVMLSRSLSVTEIPQNLGERWWRRDSREKVASSELQWSSRYCKSSLFFYTREIERGGF
jgi:hypothetical protein